MKKFTDQEVQDAFSKAPPGVKALINDPTEAANLIRSFEKKYGLHIDEIGEMAENLRNMLLSLIAPQQFYDLLIELKLTPDQVKEVMEEINTKIFVPLQKEMREQEKPEQRPVAASQLPPPVMAQPQVNVPVPSYSPPRPTPIQPPPAPTPLAMAIEKARTARQSASQMPKPAIAPQMSATQPPDHLLPLGEAEEHHVAPLPPKTVMPGATPQINNQLINPAQKAYTVPSRASVVNLLNPEDAAKNPLKRMPSPPVNLPGTNGPTPWPPAPPQPPMPPRPAAPVPAAPSYSSDPYREPVE